MLGNNNTRNSKHFLLVNSNCEIIKKSHLKIIIEIPLIHENLGFKMKLSQNWDFEWIWDSFNPRITDYCLKTEVLGKFETVSTRNLLIIVSKLRFWVNLRQFQKIIAYFITRLKFMHWCCNFYKKCLTWTSFHE